MRKLHLSTAKTTGLLYLGLAMTGMFSFLFARENLYVDGDAVMTSVNLVENETLARWGIAAEVLLVGFQALVAVWFYKLFRKRDSFTAGLIAVFGMVNAIIILVASAMWLGSLDAALAGQDVAAQMLFDIHDNLWTVGNLFFGLWLIPMGMMVKKAKMPLVLAWFLIAGGVGYILAGFVAIVLPAQTDFVDLITIPATIGEFWIIGYLLFKPTKS